jgi:hypothetical protein
MATRDGVRDSPVGLLRLGSRGLIHGSMWDREGVRIASVTQEGLIRRPRA